MRIKYIRAKNFLSIGKEPIEIDFTKYGNIINIVGQNHDRGEHASNGSGKSSVLEIIVYGLYGKLIKKMSHKEAINNKTKKGLEIEIHWDDYKIIRTRKPDSLTFMKGDKDLTLGGIPATQDEIAKKIGLSYQGFINTAFFGQHNQYAFLSCDSQTKREIVENLLSLDKYNDYAKVTKDKRKAIETQISFLIKEYELLHKSIESDQRRVAQLEEQKRMWYKTRETELNQLSMRQVELQTSISFGGKNDQEATKKEITTTDESLVKFSEAKVKFETGHHEATEKLNKWKETKHQMALQIATLSNQANSLVEEKEALKAKNERFNKMEEGVKCPVCLGDVDKKNFYGVVVHNNSRIDEITAGIKERLLAKETLEKESDKNADAMARVREAIATAQVKIQAINQKITSLEYKKKDLLATLGKDDQMSQMMLENVAGQINQKKEEIAKGDPYADMLKTVKQELDEHIAHGKKAKDDIKLLEADLPYIDYLIKAFGDNGIRKFVVDDMIPALNARVNYWLQFLIDNKLTLTFNNQLDEVIQSDPPDGDPYVYNGLSGGEHNRIDLAISQAFSYLMMLSSGTCPSIVALDEVVSYQDRQGVECIYNMIVELARDRQVIVITHDTDLLQMLDSADKIVIVKKNGFSKLVEK